MRKNISYYVRERHRGRIFSAILHFVMFLFIIFGLPSFLTPTPPEEPMAISVEILPMVAISNVKPTEPPPPEKEEKKETKPADVKKPSPPVKVVQDTPPPPAPDAVPLPQEKKPEKKPEPPKPVETPPEPPKPVEKPKDKPKEKPKKKQEDPLDAILKAVKNDAKKEKKNEEKKKIDAPPAPETPPDKKAISTHFDPNMVMGLSDKDAIRSQISKCWNPPIGAKDAQNLVILVNVEYGTDGRYIRAEISDKSKASYNSDPFFRAAADSAIRAVQRCSPLTGLPPDKYDAWHYMEINFDPKDMLN